MTNETVFQNHDQLIDPTRVLEVPMNAWKTSDESHTVLFSHGFGPCIGITVFDPLSKKGFMGHIANPVTERGRIDEMFAAVRNNVNDLSQLKIWVRGGQAGDEPELDVSSPDYYIELGKSNGNLQNRMDTVTECIATLVGHDQSSVDIQYDPEPISSGSRTMQRLDTETGEFVSHAYSTGEYQMALGELSLYGINQEGSKDAD